MVPQFACYSIGSFLYPHESHLTFIQANIVPVKVISHSFLYFYVRPES